MEFAASGVQVNAVGTNFMDFPGFLLGNRIRTSIDGPRYRSGKIRQLESSGIV